MLNTPRMESAVEAFRGVFGSKLGDRRCSTRTGRRRSEYLASSPFLHTTPGTCSSSPSTSRAFPPGAAQDLFRKVKTFQDWTSSLKSFPIFALQLKLFPLYCDFLYEERKTLVMFREKAKAMKVLTTTVQQFLADHGLTSPVPSSKSTLLTKLWVTMHVSD